MIMGDTSFTIIMKHSTYSVLVEHEQYHASEAIVAPMPVDEQQFTQHAESRQCEVGSHHGLHSLLPRYPDSHVGHLQHAHVIRAITWRQTLELELMLSKTKKRQLSRVIYVVYLFCISYRRKMLYTLICNPLRCLI